MRYSMQIRRTEAANDTLWIYGATVPQSTTIYVYDHHLEQFTSQTSLCRSKLETGLFGVLNHSPCRRMKGSDNLAIPV